MIERLMSNKISRHLDDGKAIVILGPRQSGKTTLLRRVTKDFADTVLWLNGDEPDVRLMLANISSSHLKSLIGQRSVVVIDEAQRIENVGLCLKLMVDNLPEVKILASGSSSFELAQRINEPLTGRKWEYFLYPLSWQEMVNHHGLLEERRLLHHRLVYGSYPEIVAQPGDHEARLLQLADSYMYKDILSWGGIQKPERLERLLQALAFQVGSQVSYNELAGVTGLNNETVEKYITILEKAFIVFRLGSFSRTLRNELKKSRKIYFYDNGIRNAVIRHFNPVGLRDDVGALWENYLLSERLKLMANSNLSANRFFWRTAQQQEIDYLEERNGQLSAWEFKWNPKAKEKYPITFRKTYPRAAMKTITPDNMTEFLQLQNDE